MLALPVQPIPASLPAPRRLAWGKKVGDKGVSQEAGRKPENTGPKRLIQQQVDW